jgi:allantoin racemase
MQASLDPGCKERKSGGMSRILVINPNSSEACSAGISMAIAPYRLADGPTIDVVTLREGPPAIYTWRDWHSVVEPMCRLAERETADIIIVACASDPGIEALRAATSRPVLGIFRSAVATAVVRAERFGVIGMVESSKGRHRAALRAMGLEDRLAGEVALNVSMDALLDPSAARAALVAAAKELAAMDAEAIILGCTGMAHHRAAIYRATGLPVIEPSQAATGLAVAMILGEGGSVT